MSELHHLREQAARAERLARNATDRSLAEQLRLLSQDYQSRADALAASMKPAGLPVTAIA